MAAPLCYGYLSVLDLRRSSWTSRTPALVFAFGKAGVGKTRRPLIAIIEDDAAISAMYRRQLELEEYDVALAADGRAGLALIRERRPDLVVLDLRLPRVEGLDVLRQLRTEGIFDGTPVIVVSNYADPALLEEALALGAREYHVKSQITPPQLAARIRDYLR